jgi:hypothetical protein
MEYDIRTATSETLVCLKLETFHYEKTGIQSSYKCLSGKSMGCFWCDVSYSQWTSVFSEGSKAETDWNEGSKVLFLDGKGQGGVSVIAAKKPNEFMSFKHLGVVNKGIEDLDSPQTKEWAGALENYTLRSSNNKTELIVEMDITEEYKDYFLKTWIQALNKVKELAEEKDQRSI